MTQQVYFFGDGATEGGADMKAMLGGKGANLAEMTNIGIPVPPGFTIPSPHSSITRSTGKVASTSLLNKPTNMRC